MKIEKHRDIKHRKNKQNVSFALRFILEACLRALAWYVAQSSHMTTNLF